MIQLLLSDALLLDFEIVVPVALLSVEELEAVTPPLVKVRIELLLSGFVPDVAMPVPVAVVNDA
eukprot:4852870-Pyramimonas_sp.AAC.1